MNVPMKALDAGFFFAEKADAPAHFGPLIILSKPHDAPKNYVRNLVDEWRQTREFSSPFNYRLKLLPTPAWTVLDNDDIDLDFHFRHIALPAPGDERELGILISRLHSYPLERKRPLWECYLIEGLQNDRFALFLKLHHGQLDGMGAVRLIGRFLSTDVKDQGARPPWSIGMERNKPVRPSKSRLQKTVGAWQQMANALPEAALSLGKVYFDAVTGAEHAAVAPFQAPNTILNGRIGRSRSYATQHYTLERLRRVAKCANVTINDVFLSMCGSALRRYLQEFSELPKKSLIAQVPVNVRPDKDASVGNALAFIYVSLGTDIDDPLERLSRVRESTSAAKAVHQDLSSQAIDPYTMMQQAPWITQVVSDTSGRLPPVSNLVISNVPGSADRLFLGGARVEHIYGPSVLFHGQALNITLSSYAGDLDAGFTGCRTSLPSMQKLAVYTRRELEALENALNLT